MTSAVAELEQKGVSVGEIRTVENGMVASFEDPDGNELTLL